MKPTELKKILALHVKWRQGRRGGKRANLSGANLSGANLSGANLSGANLYGANLRGANLRGADLSGANLYGANLSGANLRGANLSWADLSGANLSGADLSGADLSGAENAALVIAQTRILPEGDLIGWKKVSSKGGGTVIAKLLIPAKADRSHAFGRKCRASSAKVLDMRTLQNRKVKEAYSFYDRKFIYKVGKVVKPNKPFCKNWQEECAPGIHFFITREEAVAY